jgi:hypothetical protein
MALPALLAKVQRLLDEVSQSAASSFGDEHLVGYYALLIEMEDWHDKHQNLQP